MPQASSGTTILPSDGPKPGIACSTNSLTSVKKASSAQMAGRRLTSRIATSNQVSALRHGTTRGSRCWGGAAGGVATIPGAGSGIRQASSSTLAKISRPHGGIVQQIRTLAGERDLAGLHHVAAVAHLERELRVLLDQQDRDAFAGNLDDGFEHLLHHQRREAHRRLV